MSGILEAQGVSKWFGEVVALNDVQVSIQPGVTGLLGPNGAGKSTFIKLALGLYAPSRGRLTVLGESPRNNRRILRRVGYCPEVDKFYETMSGYEFVYWLARFWGMPGKAAAAATEAACERVGMLERMDDPLEEYSKGMRQRIKLAQALVAKPDLLFLDEPMAGLDPKGREEMFALIRRLGNEGVAVVVSSHILYEIERVTDNVVLLYRGSVLAHGRIREIRDLIDEHPHSITVDTPRPKELAHHFLDKAGVTSLEFSEGALLVRTSEPALCYERLNELALDAFPIEGIRCADDSLQSVFDYLVG